VRAVLCKAYGPPESLVIEEVPDPTPGPGQLLIDVRAAALNFPDVLMIEGRYQSQPPFPFSPGS
jgi:NADPH:quinone reductase